MTFSTRAFEKRPFCQQEAGIYYIFHCLVFSKEEEEEERQKENH